MTELELLNLKAARDYLQSAVFIDDKIFVNDSGIPQKESVYIPARKPVYITADTETPANQALEQADKVDDMPGYNPKNIVSSFSKEGIICALYEPQPGFETDVNSEVYKLCERPDILILDWDFSGDQGEKALELILELCKRGQNDFPHHTRLIAIYTSDPSLVGVSNIISDSLTKNSLEASPVEVQLRLKSGAVRLVIFGKPIARFGDEEKFTVEESQLATRLINEFVDMHSGIVPSLALCGLSAIRRNSKRILDRMNGGLDGPFLIHRRMTMESEEAFHQIPELLAEELRAVIEDDMLLAGNVQCLADEFDSNPNIEESDKGILSNDLDRKPSAIARDIKEDDGTIPSAHAELASLYSSKTYYSKESRSLTFGSIVRFKRDVFGRWAYGICLVPACDSVRLNGARVSFPFWTLNENSYSRKTETVGFVLTLENEEKISLAASGKAGDMLWTESLVLDQKAKTVSAKNVDGAYIFDALERQQFEWIGQLKPLHAHRIARTITDGLGRVGVSEVDWIRALSGKH